MKRRESDSFLMLFLKLRGGINVYYKNIWGIERSGFFNGREKWAKGFENQRV